jgi:molybdenum-dependent DNA-binding transcriptional regulator ModE
MGKKYEPVPDEKRKQLISLIYEKGMNISKASKEAGIYYPTAKAINKIYLRQNRICKKTNRDRTKKSHNIKIKVQPAEEETQ